MLRKNWGGGRLINDFTLLKRPAMMTETHNIVNNIALRKPVHSVDTRALRNNLLLDNDERKSLLNTSLL